MKQKHIMNMAAILEGKISLKDIVKRDKAQTLQIVNVISTADLCQPVQIQRLNEFAWGRFDLENNYNGKVGYVKDNDMKGRVTVFASGKLISTGAKSVNQSVKQLNRTMIHLSDNHFVQKIKLKPQIRNIVGVWDSRKRIDMNSAVLGMARTMYEPEVFPGIILRTDIGPTCLIFASGKVVIAGAHSEAELDVVRIWLEQKLKDFSIEDQVRLTT